MRVKEQASLIQPSIGAIVVNYNYARFAPEAIESVLNQDPPFDEIVVVDDGSTDRSLQVIEPYQSRVKVISKQNGGQLSACIAGIAALKTDYVYVLDADDYVAPGFVGALQECFAEWPGKIQFQLAAVDADRNRLGTIFPTYSKDYGANQMVQDNRTIGFYLCPPTSGNIFRRDALAAMKLDQIDLRDFVDGPPALAMPYLGPIKSVNKPLAYYRVHGQNHSRWDQPDTTQLQGEIDWFYRRWADVCKLLDRDRPPFGDDEPLYVLERQLMRLALTPGAPLTGAVAFYLRRLLAAHLLRRQKVMLAVWAIAFVIPVAGWRKKLVFARRSPLNRSAGLQRLIRILTSPGRGVLAIELENGAPAPEGSLR